MKPGDWLCQCGTENFARRTYCLACYSARPAAGRGALAVLDAASVVAAAPAARAGDWVCPRCRVNNFASRTACFKCGAPAAPRVAPPAAPVPVAAPAPAAAAAPDDALCCVCMEAPRTHAPLTCLHRCLCAGCVAAVDGRCPVCRAAFAEARRVYV